MKAIEIRQLSPDFWEIKSHLGKEWNFVSFREGDEKTEELAKAQAIKLCTELINSGDDFSFFINRLKQTNNESKVSL